MPAQAGTPPTFAERSQAPAREGDNLGRQDQRRDGLRCPDGRSLDNERCGEIMRLGSKLPPASTEIQTARNEIRGCLRRNDV